LIAPTPAGDVGEPRFSMLETIREFALARLDATGQSAAAHAAMAAYLSALARGGQWALFGPDHAAWADRLGRELDNFRAAMTWAQAAGRRDVCIDLAASLWHLMYLRGAACEARDWLRLALAVADAPGERRLAALTGACALAGQLGDSGAVVAERDELAHALPGVADPAARSLGFMALGLVASGAGDPRRAGTVALAGADAARGINPQLLSICLNNAADAAIKLGAFDDALEYLSEGLVAAQEAASGHVVCHILANTGHVFLLRDDVQAATRHYADILRRLDDSSPPADIITATQSLAWCAAQIGRADAAARLLGFAAAQWAQLGLTLSGFELDLQARALQTLRSSLGDTRLREVWARGRELHRADGLRFARQLAADLPADDRGIPTPAADVSETRR
jgi:tetratricopeptide (TPR) repeat protein